MNIGRREFMKVLSAGTLAAGTVSKLQARTAKSLPPKAVGILYDATLCIGCKSCEVNCKRVNAMPSDHSPFEWNKGIDGAWDSGTDLNAKTLNKIKVFIDGNGLNKDAETDGYGFIRRACMHCVDPDCVSACPVTALTKENITGIVAYDKDACIGCRYCQIACPYNIPKFQYDEAIPEIIKCEMCTQVQAEGGIPACCEFCPTGASIFGDVRDLLDEAKKRIQTEPGTTYDYPLESLSSRQIQKRPSKKYVDYIYGENEGGGTQYLMLSAIPFAKLGLPILGKKSGASKSEGLQHAVYKGMIAPVVLLAGLLFAAHKSTKSIDALEKGGQS